jgi:hypothetical protein
MALQCAVGNAVERRPEGKRLRPILMFLSRLFSSQILHKKQKPPTPPISQSIPAWLAANPPLHPNLGRSTKPVLEFIHDTIDFLFGAAPRIAISALKQDHQIGAPPLDSIDFIGAQLSPMVLDFISELLPFGFESIELHEVTSISD